MQNHQILHASTTTNGAVLHTIFRSLYDLLFAFYSTSKKYLVWIIYIKYHFMHDHQTWYGIFHNCPIIYVIYRQTSITVQYKLT